MKINEAQLEQFKQSLIGLIVFWEDDLPVDYHESSLGIKKLARSLHKIHTNQTIFRDVMIEMCSVMFETPIEEIKKEAEFRRERQHMPPLVFDYASEEALMKQRRKHENI